MVSLGIALGYPAKSPVVTGVVLSGSRSEPVVEHQFELKTSSDDVAGQINDLVRALRSKISGMGVTACTVKIADVGPTATKKLTPRNRLMIEGALVFACRDQEVLDIRIMNGRDIGSALGCSKAEAVAEGARLVAKYDGAAAAALVALVD